MNKPLFNINPELQDQTEQPQGEARMREALGLRSDGTRIPPSGGHRPDRPSEHGAGNPRRHRFVQEGEIPVEVMTLRDHSRNGPAAPLAVRHRVDESALAAERLAREQAERAFAEATDRLREVQTKLGHAELSRDEALGIAAERLSRIEALEAQLREMPPPARVAVARKPAVPRPRGRQPVPKPVKWWIKPSPAE